MADDREGSNSRDSSPEPPSQRAIPLESTSKFRTGADAELIQFVRSRPVLYDPSHSRYMDNPLKNAMWVKIGTELKASPSACKARWNNIRDNYRKALRRKILGGKMQYKFSKLLVFMDDVYNKKNIAARDEIKTRSSSESSNESTAAAEDKAQESKDDEDADHSDDAMSNQSEHVIDEIFDKSANAPHSFSRANVSNTSQSKSANLSRSVPTISAVSFPPLATEQDRHTGNKQTPKSSEQDAVDVFLAAIGPTLKGLGPYNLSLAKAEIFATVHKYELKGIMGNGWVSPDCPDTKPLP